MVQVEYRIRKEDRPAFLQAMKRLSLERRRDGAYAWGITEHTADPERVMEWFLVESWAEHLRQHHRVSKADADLQARRCASTSGRASRWCTTSWRWIWTSKRGAGRGPAHVDVRFAPSGGLKRRELSSGEQALEILYRKVTRCSPLLNYRGRQPGRQAVVGGEALVDAELSGIGHSSPIAGALTPGMSSSASTKRTASAMGVGFTNLGCVARAQEACRDHGVAAVSGTAGVAATCPQPSGANQVRPVDASGQCERRRPAR